MLGASTQSTWEQVEESKKTRMGSAPSEPWYYRSQLARQVLFLHEDVIHEQGTLDEVLKNP